MKLIKVLSLGLIAACLGACAHKHSQTTSVPPSSSTSSTVVVPAK